MYIFNESRVSGFGADMSSAVFKQMTWVQSFLQYKTVEPFSWMLWYWDLVDIKDFGGKTNF
jgi:hypothetical protein